MTLGSPFPAADNANRQQSSRAYTITLKDAKAGKTGRIDVKDSNAQGPSWEFIAAFDKVNETMGFTP